MRLTENTEPSAEHETISRRFIESLKKSIEKDGYQILFSVVILLDLISMGLNTFVLPSWASETIRIVDYVIQAAFILEIIANLIVYKLKYFYDPWKVLDFLVTVVTTIPIGGWSQYSRVIRSVRVARSFRAFSHLRQLHDLVTVIGDSMKGVLWTVILLLILFYCYAVIGTLMFGVQFDEWFGSLWKSMYTLFQIMTLEAWSDSIARPVIAEYPLSWIYFISFVIFSAFIMMNVVVGIIVDTTHEKQRKQRDINNDPDLKMIEKEDLQRIIDDLMIKQITEFYQRIHEEIERKKRGHGVESKMSEKEMDLKSSRSSIRGLSNLDVRKSLVIAQTEMPVFQSEVMAVSGCSTPAAEMSNSEVMVVSGRSTPTSKKTIPEEIVVSGRSTPTPKKTIPEELAASDHPMSISKKTIPEEIVVSGRSTPTPKKTIPEELAASDHPMSTPENTHTTAN